jgi:23S rRNA (adenine2503-C2)-methyltransferase
MVEVEDSRSRHGGCCVGSGRDVFKVNLIPYNPTGMYDGSSRGAIGRFKHVLDKARVPATVRLTRGRDIAAACGQLAATS